MKAEEMYASMKPWRLFFTIALPGMVSMFAMSIYSIIEGVFIGQTLGENAFAAINIAMPLVMINFSLADLVGVGASVPISIALGKNDKKTANNVFSCSVIMIFLAAIIMGSIMYFAAEPLCRMMGADDLLLETSVKYLRTYAICSPLCTIFFAMDNYLRISGFVKTSMFINIGCNVGTFGFLILFLFVLKMDVSGSAFGTCISMCICSVVAIIPFLAKRTLLQFTKPKFNMKMFKEIVACGSPVFLSNVAGRVTSILMNISLMTLGVETLGEGGGTTAVATYAVMMYASDFCQPLLYGMSDAMSPAIGFNYGAKNYNRVRKIIKCVFTGTCIIGVVSTVFMELFPEVIVSLFANAEDTQLVELSTEALKLFSLAYLFRWISLTIQNFLSAIEKPVQATFLAVAVALVFPVICLGALWNMSLDGIWLNMAATSVLAAVLAVILLSRVYKKMKYNDAN